MTVREVLASVAFVAAAITWAVIIIRPLNSRVGTRPAPTGMPTVGATLVVALVFN